MWVCSVSVFEVSTYIGDNVFHISLHLRRIEVVSDEVHCSLSAHMSHVFVELLEDKRQVYLWKDKLTSGNSLVM